MISLLRLASLWLVSLWLVPEEAAPDIFEEGGFVGGHGDI